MALINPNSLYTAGAVRVDSSPSVNFYARLQAQKQAKEEAFDQYIQGLGGKLTPTGVRAVDIPEFNDKVQRWKQFVMQNKGNLSKSPELQMQANRLYQDALSIPTWSKQIEEGKKPFVEKALDPKWRQQVNPSVFQDLDATDQPRNIKDKNGDWIPNPKWRPIDYNSVHFREPNFDFGKTFEGWSKGMDLTENIGDVVSRNPVTGTAKVAFEKRFDPTQVKQIAANAARSLADNPDYLDYYTKRLHNISEKEYKELNDIYREVVDGGKKYVRPDGKIEIVGGEIDSPEKLAMADAIKQARGLTQKGTKDILDRDLQNQRSINKIFINQAGRGDSGVVNNNVGNAFDDFENNDFGKFKVLNGNWYNKDGTPKSGDIFIKGEYIPATIKSALASANIKPEYLIAGVNAKLKDGVITSISSKTIGTITREAMGGVYQKKMDTEPKFRGELKFGKDGKQTPKAKTKNDPLGLGL